MAAIDIGALDQRVQFQVRAAGADALGEPDGARVNHGTPCWASVRPVRGAQRLQAGAVQETLDVMIVVRYREDITGRHSIIWRERPYDIVGEPVPLDGGREWLEFSAVHGVRDGR